MGFFSGGANQERRNALAAMLSDLTFQDSVKRGLFGAVQGVGRGISADLLGGPVDLMTEALNVPAGLFGKRIENPVGGSEWIGNALVKMGMLPKKTDHPAEIGGRVLGGLLASPQVVGKVGQAVENVTQGMARNAMVPRTLNPQAGVVDVATAMGLNTKTQIPADPIFSEAVKNTSGATITDRGLQLRVQRSQMPEQAMSDSVRGGVFYLPEGAAQAKHYSTGKNGYGGTQKIAGETLVSNPLFVKGATGGKAPEAAYDQMLGKGAYQKMRSDALKSYGGWGGKKDPALVDEFLDQYAPELSGMGQYILQNSKQGNQLAYALQEAAVASEARRRGYDSVLGYSKGKSGPFISELFDVREQAYPNAQGASRIWEDYLP